MPSKSMSQKSNNDLRKNNLIFGRVHSNPSWHSDIEIGKEVKTTIVVDTSLRFLSSFDTSSRKQAPNPTGRIICL